MPDFHSLSEERRIRLCLERDSTEQLADRLMRLQRVNPKSPLIDLIINILDKRKVDHD